MPPWVVAPYRIPLTAIKPPYGSAASGVPRNEYNTFSSPDFAWGGLVNVNGTLYGTTSSGGTFSTYHSYGTVSALKPYTAER